MSGIIQVFLTNDQLVALGNEALEKRSEELRLSKMTATMGVKRCYQDRKYINRIVNEQHRIGAILQRRDERELALIAAEAREKLSEDAQPRGVLALVVV